MSNTPAISRTNKPSTNGARPVPEQLEKRIAAAAKTKDTALLYEAGTLELLAQARHEHPIAWEKALADIKQGFGRSVRLEGLKGLVNDAEDRLDLRRGDIDKTFISDVPGTLESHLEPLRKAFLRNSNKPDHKAAQQFATALLNDQTALIELGTAVINEGARVDRILQELSMLGVTKKDCGQITYDAWQRAAPAHAKKIKATLVHQSEGDSKEIVAIQPSTQLEQLYAHAESGRFIYEKTGADWPAKTVDPRFVMAPGKGPASRWLLNNRQVAAVTWSPGDGRLIHHKVPHSSGLWIAAPGEQTFNYYQKPTVKPGKAELAGPWVDHIRLIYPEEAEHLLDYFAFKAQHPGEKPNHGALLGGPFGIGKDSIIVPVRHAVGEHNCHDVSPSAMLESFNSFAESVLVIIGEVHELTRDRYVLYEKMKDFMVTPPYWIQVNKKYIKKYFVRKVAGVIATTNHRNGLYLPEGDRRWFVAWSPIPNFQWFHDQYGTEDEPNLYFKNLYEWFESGGIEHAVAYLLERDISNFDAKSPPPRTAAWRAAIDAGRSPEQYDFMDAIQALSSPESERPKVLTIWEVKKTVPSDAEFHRWLTDPKHRRKIPILLEEVGYTKVWNPDEKTRGRWSVGRKLETLYARTDLTEEERVSAARKHAKMLEDVMNTEFRTPAGLRNVIDAQNKQQQRRQGDT